MGSLALYRLGEEATFRVEAYETNVCPSKDKAILCGISQPHSVLPEIKNGLSAWLNAG